MTNLKMLTDCLLFLWYHLSCSILGVLGWDCDSHTCYDSLLAWPYLLTTVLAAMNGPRTNGFSSNIGSRVFLANPLCISFVWVLSSCILANYQADNQRRVVVSLFGSITPILNKLGFWHEACKALSYTQNPTDAQSVLFLSGSKSFQ